MSNIPTTQPVNSTEVKDSGGHSHPTEGCGKCMRGGFPVKKEMLSFVVLILVAATTILGVLLINEKRANLSSMGYAPAGENKEKTYDIPDPKNVVSEISLPEPEYEGSMSVEEAIKLRRSKRVYSDEPVTLSELSQILWSAQGVTDESGHRAAPSARGVYPYSLYVVVRNVDGLDAGLYLYDSETHSLGDLNMSDAGDNLIAAEVQDNSQKAPVVIAMAAAYGKAAEKFPDNPETVTLLEGGHIGQNVYLQAESLGMATVVTAGFNPVAVGDALGLEKSESVIYLIPFGHIGVEVAE